MATVKCCDRCGALVKPENATIMEMYNTYSSNIKWDLCPDCDIAAKKFIKEYDKNGES